MTERSKVLIVDDEPFNVDYLEQELDELGCETITAVNGREALKAVEAERPDLILLDVMMPVMDGFTACRILKESEETRLIPVIIMTALDSVDDRVRGIEAGADDFLTKPVNERELRARIQTALMLKHTVDRKIGELRQIRDHFAKFVPSAVRRLVTLNPEAPELQRRERDVSILFLDISGYTRLSEEVPSEVVGNLVDRYFSAFLDRVAEADGDINETVGDGFLAIFQDKDRAGHALKAVSAAFALMAVTDALNDENKEHPLDVHVGIACGPALVGSARFEGERGTRWVFSASGPEVNLAARLAGIAAAREILVSAETARRIGARYAVESRGYRALKNIAEAVEVFRVSGRAEGSMPAS